MYYIKCMKLLNKRKEKIGYLKCYVKVNNWVFRSKDKFILVWILIRGSN